MNYIILILLLQATEYNWKLAYIHINHSKIIIAIMFDSVLNIVNVFVTALLCIREP
jgi:hypothetical protein